MRRDSSTHRREFSPAFAIAACGIVLTVNWFLCVALYFFAEPLAPWTGLLQLVYVVPVAWWSRHEKAHDAFAGFVVGAALSFLASARCGFAFHGF